MKPWFYFLVLTIILVGIFSFLNFSGLEKWRQSATVLVAALVNLTNVEGGI